MEFGKFLPFDFAADVLVMCIQCSISIFPRKGFSRVILNKILNEFLVSYTSCKFNGNIFFRFD